jgi:hypothetical protein
LVDDLGRSDDISDSVDDDTSKTSVGDVEENGSQGVKSKQDNDSSNDTGEGSADTSLGLDGSSREGSGGGVGTQERTEKVANTDGDELLRRVDDIVVDTAEGLGDGNVLNQDNDDGGGKLRDEGPDDGRVDLGNSSMGEATGNVANNADARLFAVVDVHSSADTDVEQDDKGSSKGGDEEVQLGTVRLLLGHGATKNANGIEHDQG